MELQEKMYNLSERIKQLKENIQTEEARWGDYWVILYFKSEYDPQWWFPNLKIWKDPGNPQTKPMNGFLALKLKNMKKSTMLYCKKVSH